MEVLEGAERGGGGGRARSAGGGGEDGCNRSTSICLMEERIGQNHFPSHSLYNEEMVRPHTFNDYLARLYRDLSSLSVLDLEEGNS